MTNFTIKTCERYYYCRDAILGFTTLSPLPRALSRVYAIVPKRSLQCSALVYFAEGSQQPNGPNASRLVESLLGTRSDRVHVEQFAATASVLPPARSAHFVEQVSVVQLFNENKNRTKR